MNIPQEYKLTVAKLLAYHDVRDRSDYKDKTIEQIWERVLGERTDDEYLIDADQILSVAMPLIEKRAREEILNEIDVLLLDGKFCPFAPNLEGWRLIPDKKWQSLRESK